MDFIKNLEPILICDIGASACDPTNHICLLYTSDAADE